MVCGDAAADVAVGGCDADGGNRFCGMANGGAAAAESYRAWTACHSVAARPGSTSRAGSAAAANHSERCGCPRRRHRRSCTEPRGS